MGLPGVRRDLDVSNDTDLPVISPWRNRRPILWPHVFVERMVQARPLAPVLGI